MGTTRLRLPPALKPLMAVRDMLRPREAPCVQIQRIADAQFSMAVGKGYSGAGLSPDSKVFYGELTVRNFCATAAPHKVVIVVLSVLE
jgi:hypothetical protein